MAYDKGKDRELASWQMNPAGSDENIQVSVQQYDNGPKKLQIGPRTFIRRDGESRYGKLGRMTEKEVEWLQTILPQALSELQEEAAPESNDEQSLDLG